MTTWADYREGILRGILGDETDPNNPNDVIFSNASLLSYINEALKYLSLRFGKDAYSEIVGDGSTYEFTLPTNFASVSLVETDTRVFLPELKPVPGQGFSVTTMSSSSGQKGYMVHWPERGKITFGRIIDDGDTYILHYLAYFTEIVDDTDELDVESWLEIPLAFYTAHLCYFSLGGQRARNAQWADKMDLNVGNPVTGQALMYYKQYLALLHDRT